MVCGAVRFVVPQGWTILEERRMDGDEHGLSAMLVLACETGYRGFHANMILSTSDEIPEDIDTWVTKAAEQTIEALPGFVTIDIQGWMNEEFGGIVRCGTYTLDDRSLTMIQWLCASERSLFIATGTCATEDFALQFEVFDAIVNSSRGV